MIIWLVFSMREGVQRGRGRAPELGARTESKASTYHSRPWGRD